MFTRLIVVCALLLTTGCSLFGMAIGAAVPRYSSEFVPAVGNDVHVETENGDAFSGKLVVSDPSHVVVFSDGVRRDVERWQIDTVAKRVGSEWKTGLHVGLALDVVCIVGALAALLVAGAAWHNGWSSF